MQVKTGIVDASISNKMLLFTTGHGFGLTENSCSICYSLFSTARQEHWLWTIIRWTMVRFVTLVITLLAQSAFGSSFEKDLVAAAMERTKHNVIYNGAYFSIPYPNGDVPAHYGVCTDVVIRSYRSLGADLQQLVHEDMTSNFSAYPSERIWGLSRPDRNIDHRRVPNLQVFFTRHGMSLPKSQDAKDYLPGDLVTWMLPGNLPHIGIVTDTRSQSTGNPLIVHNIGAGPRLEDILFSFEISGHYRYIPENYRAID